MNLGQLVNADRVCSGEIRRPRHRSIRLGGESLIARVYECIAGRGKANVRDISTTLGTRPAQVSVMLVLLVGSGHIERIGRGVYRVKR